MSVFWLAVFPAVGAMPETQMSCLADAKFVMSIRQCFRMLQQAQYAKTKAHRPRSGRWQRKWPGVVKSGPSSCDYVLAGNIGNIHPCFELLIEHRH